MLDSHMSRAIELAVENARSGRGGPFAAIVANQERVLGEGVNLVVASLDPTAHAEVVAIRRACQALGSFRLEGASIYTSCEPCPMCLGAIYWARLDRIYFAATAQDAAEAGFDDALLYRQFALPRQQRLIPMIPLMRNESLAAFDQWRRQPRRVPY